MKRRNFLQLLGIGPAAAIAPALASQPPKQKRIGEFKVGEVRRFIEDVYEESPLTATQRNDLPFIHRTFSVKQKLGWRKWDGKYWIPCTATGELL